MLGVAFLGGCGGSNSDVTLPSASGAPTPVALPSAAAFISQPLVEPLPAPSAGQYIYTLPADGNYGGQIAIPVAGSVLPPGVTLTITSQNSLPTSVPVLQAQARAPQGRLAQQSAPITPFYYLTLVWSAAVQLGTGATFTVKPPAGTVLSGVSYDVAFFDPYNADGNWITASAGTTLANDPVDPYLFSGLSSGTYYVGHQPYTIALYAVSPAAPPPTPGPVSHP